jgi:hypothetical protein
MNILRPVIDCLINIDFRLSCCSVINFDSILGLLRRVLLGDVTGVSEVTGCLHLES